jgi:RNAse (barnase) inhibitor barstar
MTGPDAGAPGGGLAERAGGIYRILEPTEIVESHLARVGWRVAVLPEVARTRDFYASLRRVLDLPDYTGANLDALWDVLTDLTGPTALVWPHHGTFATARPERWQRILAVLEERAAKDPPFALVLT